MRIDQLVVAASPGDAITNFALALRQVLTGQVETDLYARYYHDDLAGTVKPIADYGSRRDAQRADILLFHVSIGAAEVTDYVLGRPERLVLVYHNISPSEPFRPYDPDFADLLDQGRAELEQLLSRATAVLAESEFNAREVRALGFAEVSVVPLIVDVAARHPVRQPRVPTAELLPPLDGPIILAVGQLLPHKRVDFLVEAFHILCTYLMPEARLVVVGNPRLPGYAEALQTQVDELHLPRAWLTGSVSQPTLDAWWARADLYVTASEHEGFCVPLLEAMSCDLPFQARRFGAVPETAGAAGLILDPQDGPTVAAEAWAEVLSDNGLRTDLVLRGRERLAAFEPGRTREAWRQALLGLV